MSAAWSALPYESWTATRDTLHAHTQVLGKLAAKLAPPEPQLQHASLRLTPRGWETLPLPAPDGSGVFAVTLDLRSHEVVIAHSDGRIHAVSLTPNRSVGQVTREVLSAITDLVGQFPFDPTPQETPWTTPLDEDKEHATYDTRSVSAYFACATQASLVLAELRAPYRGRSTPVSAWWGTFDLAISIFSGQQIAPPSSGFIARNSGDAQQIEIGWWPGDARHPQAAFFGFVYPAIAGGDGAEGLPAPAHWDADLGEYVLEWDDARAYQDPVAVAIEFGRAVIRHSCAVCVWPQALAESAIGELPAVS